MSEIIVKNCSMTYDQRVLGPCSFVVPANTTLAVMGPSGSGKSTLLKAMAGLIDAEGTIEIKDCQRLVMVFDDGQLIEVLSAAENIALGMKKEGYCEEEIRQRTFDIAAQLELMEHLDKKPSELSYGQRKRVALARALVRDFDVLLMDEPFSGLDVLLRKQILNILKKMQEEKGFICVYATHDSKDARLFSDQVLILHEGHVQMLASVQECTKHPANAFVEALFE